uniref:Uncharacterized protein n=1 Tax=Lactuca sativa TaxID=4236 RepID=A0A9R1X480_LACSA|nr:hypothetical protein LSAT_V11C700377250 [Lactuca sativa]
MTTAPTASEAASKLISSDLKEIGDATMKLADHVMKLGVTGGFINTSLQCFACFVVIPLCQIRVDRCTNVLEYRILFASRTHQSFWRIQECIHQKQRNFQFHGYLPLIFLPSLGFDRLTVIQHQVFASVRCFVLFVTVNSLIIHE